MRVGELAQRTGLSTRMLRYYEAQGLLHPSRGANGYREFDESDVERAATVGSLIQSGLPTKLVAIVLSAQDAPQDWSPSCDQEFLRILRQEAVALDAKIACLKRSRDAVQHYLNVAPPNAAASP